MAIVVTLLIFAVFGLLFWASYSIRSGVYLRTLSRAHTREKVVALTFDDGPDPATTSHVLDVLKENGVEAAFFVKGERAEASPELIERTVREGHLVGNHTWSHRPNFPVMRIKKMIEELDRCDQILKRITGKPVRLFRPPYGVTNPSVARAVRGRGYRIIGWSARSFDTQGGDREKVVRRILRGLKSGAVILLHDDRPESDRLLTLLLEALRAAGYRIDRIDRLFGFEEK